MAHWFDRLAQPHTRRTTLKAGVIGGAMLVLPLSRSPQAQATATEPCFKPCVAAAATAWTTRLNGCDRQVLISGVSVGTGQLVGSFLGLLSGWHCVSGADLSWHEAVEACRGSECGDPAKYPYGQLPRAPGPKCTPGEEVECGDRCCSIVAECCPCSADSSGYCCCAAGKCGSSGCT
jgi:hypothetical protein